MRQSTTSYLSDQKKHWYELVAEPKITMQQNFYRQKISYQSNCGF